MSKEPTLILADILDYVCRELTYIESTSYFPTGAIVIMERAVKTLTRMLEELGEREMKDEQMD